MRAGLRDRKLLDDRVCWKKWHELGTLREVKRWFKEEGFINPKTGEPPTVSGIEKAAKTWAVQNLEEARRDLTIAWRQEGYNLTDEEWKKAITSFAKTTYYQRPKKLQQILDSLG